jgi:hypothetical protein
MEKIKWPMSQLFNTGDQAHSEVLVEFLVAVNKFVL